jgi:predicted component of type VI protein secretion system
MARLIQESGGGKREVRITSPVTIGRSPSATFPIDDKTLSREHTLISGQAGRYTVKDLESKNGTYLNGQLIRRPEPLKHGDRIRVGPATFMIVWDSEDASAGRPAGNTTATSATAPARPASRPATRREAAVGSGGGFARFFATVVALGVFVVGTWFAKQLVVTFLFPRIPQ